MCPLLYRKNSTDFLTNPVPGVRTELSGVRAAAGAKGRAGVWADPRPFGAGSTAVKTAPTTQAHI